MPVIFRHNGMRFFFYSNEGSPREPIHVHVMRGACEAKIWVVPRLLVDWNTGFKESELRDIVSVIRDRRELIMACWHDYFGA
jgi:hypothetical protein